MNESIRHVRGQFSHTTLGLTQEHLPLDESSVPTLRCATCPYTLSSALRLLLMVIVQVFTASVLSAQEQTAPDKPEGGKVDSQPSRNKAAEQQIRFTPTYQVQASSPLLAQAHKVFFSSLSPSRGLYRNQGLVFSVVRINCKVEKLRYVEGTAMLRAIAQVRKAFPKLPKRFNVSNRVLENHMDYHNRIYHYTLAIQENDIIKIIQDSTCEVHEPSVP